MSYAAVLYVLQLCGGSVADETGSLVVPDIVHSTPSPPTSTFTMPDTQAPELTQSHTEGQTDSPLASEPVKIPKAVDQVDSGAKVPSVAEKVSLTPPMLGSVQRENGHSPHQPKTLLQEFHLVNFNIANVKADEVN